MFSGKHKLTKEADFKAVYRVGSYLSFGNISLKFKENKLENSRIGLSVGVSFSPKATERNRIKRQIREIIRKNWENIKKGFDIVVMIKRNKKEALSSQSLEQDFTRALEKGKLII